MQRLEVSGAVRLIYRSLGVKGLRGLKLNTFASLRFTLVIIRAKIWNF